MPDWTHGKPGRDTMLRGTSFGSGELALSLSDGGDESASGGATIEQRIQRYFEELRDNVYSYLMAIGALPADAEEITQEAFIRLYQQLLARSEILDVRSWLFRTARNLKIDESRSWRTRALVPEENVRESLASHRDPNPDPEASVIATEKTERLRKAMRTLTSLQCEYLHLRAEGLRYRQIAEIYGVSVPTVQDVIRRAVERLGKDIQ